MSLAARGRPTVAAILVAGGSGSRLGADVPKAFCVVGKRTLLEHAAARFLAHRSVDTVVVVAPESHLEQARDLTGAVVVAGGRTRQASVRAGLAAVTSGVDFVLVHDVARPFVPASVIGTVVAALKLGADAAVPVLPIHDTVRRIDGGGAFVEVLDRSALVAVQTPQGFDRATLVRAHDVGRDLDVTDDAALVEALGGRVVAVPGADESFKITRAWDLVMAAAVAANE